MFDKARNVEELSEGQTRVGLRLPRPLVDKVVDQLHFVQGRSPLLASFVHQVLL